MSGHELLKHEKTISKSNQTFIPKPHMKRKIPINFLRLLPVLTEARSWPSHITLHGSFLFFPSRIQQQEDNTPSLRPQAGQLCPALRTDFFLCLGLFLLTFHATTVYFLLASVAEEAMAPHSSTLAGKIPWTGEPGGLPSMGSHRVRHDWSNLAAAAAAAVDSSPSLSKPSLSFQLPDNSIIPLSPWCPKHETTLFLVPLVYSSPNASITVMS